MSDAAAETATELHRQAALMRQQANYAGAERGLLRALELEHDFAAAHLELGLTYRDQGRFEDAADYLQLAVHFAPDSVSAWLELGAVLVRLGRVDAAVGAYREARAREPRHAAGWLKLGNLFKAGDNWNAAIDCYRGAAACDPDSADAHSRLGYALYKAGHYAESRASFEAVLAAHPDMVEAQHNLGLLLLETGHADEALLAFKRVLASNPEIIETRACIAHALRDLGRLDEAIVYYDEVLAAQPDFADAVINRSYALLMKEDYVAGWDAYGRRFSSGALVARDFAHTPWQGEPPAGKRILVYAEQGLGDEIMFASCIADLLKLDAHCVIECNTRLAALFRRSFPQAHVHGADKKDHHGWLGQLPLVDFQVAIGSLPQYFRRARTAFPDRPGYLVADPERSGFWRTKLMGKAGLRVGVAWRGGTLRSRQFTRSTALSQWLPLLRREGAAFYALQYGDISAELDDLRVQFGVNVERFGDAIGDLDELAAIINALDLVITIDNTVAHLAGALGKPIWTLLPCNPEWRYPRQGSAMPWYPAMRLFHRARDEGWEAVIDRVASEIGGVMRDARSRE